MGRGHKVRAKDNMVQLKEIAESKELKLLIGAISILALIFLQGMNETVHFFKYAVMGGLLSLFFFAPVKDLFIGRFTMEDGIIMLIGGLYLIFYFFFTQITLKTFFTDIIESVVLVTVISLGLKMVEEYAIGTIKEEVN